MPGFFGTSLRAARRVALLVRGNWVTRLPLRRLVSPGRTVAAWYCWPNCGCWYPLAELRLLVLLAELRLLA